MYLPQSHKIVSIGGAPYSFVKRVAGALSSASALYYERVLISCLQQLDALEANDYTNTTKTPAASISLTAHNTLNGIMSP